MNFVSPHHGFQFTASLWRLHNNALIICGWSNESKVKISSLTAICEEQAYLVTDSCCPSLVGHYVLEEARRAEQVGREEDDEDGDVGLRTAAETTGLERIADGDVAIEGQQNGQPGVGQTDSEDHGKHPEEDVRMYLLVLRPTDVAQVSQEDRRQKGKRVVENHPAQNYRGRHDGFVVEQDDDRNGVANDADDGDRKRNADFADESHDPQPIYPLGRRRRRRRRRLIGRLSARQSVAQTVGYVVDVQLPGSVQQVALEECCI